MASYGHCKYGRDDSFFLHVKQYKAAITGRQLRGRRAVGSGIGRHTNYCPGMIRVTSGYIRDTFSVPYNTLLEYKDLHNTLSEYKDLLGSQARHP